MKYLLIVLVAGLLTGCSLDNPLGMTDRQNIRAQAYVQAAQAQADAQKHIADQETIRTGMWASLALPLLMVAGGIILAGMVVYWQGRIAHTRTMMQQPAVFAAPPVRDLPQVAELRRLAQSQGYSLEIVGSVAYLVDASGQRRGQRLLTG